MDTRILLRGYSRPPGEIVPLFLSREYFCYLRSFKISKINSTSSSPSPSATISS